MNTEHKTLTFEPDFSNIENTAKSKRYCKMTLKGSINRPTFLALLPSSLSLTLK